MAVTHADQRQICVFCRRHQVVVAWRPFCSERCKLQDLARWADGAYAVPGEADDSERERQTDEDKR